MKVYEDWIERVTSTLQACCDSSDFKDHRNEYGNQKKSILGRMSTSFRRLGSRHSKMTAATPVAKAPEVHFKIAFDKREDSGHEGILYYHYDSTTLEIKYLMMQVEETLYQRSFSIAEFEFDLAFQI